MGVGDQKSADGSKGGNPDGGNNDGRGKLVVEDGMALDEGDEAEKQQTEDPCG